MVSRTAAAMVLALVAALSIWAAPVLAQGDESAPAEAVARVVIPSIGVDSPVEEVFASGGQWRVPRYMVGHLGETVQPGEPGVAAFTGHITSVFGNVFQHLEDVRVGDEVRFEFPSSTQEFQVTDVRVIENSDLSVLLGPPEPVAVLMTCTGDWDWNAWDYTHRLVVIARPIGPSSHGGDSVAAEE